MSNIEHRLQGEDRDRPERIAKKKSDAHVLHTSSCGLAEILYHTQLDQLVVTVEGEARLCIDMGPESFHDFATRVVAEAMRQGSELV